MRGKVFFRVWDVSRGFSRTHDCGKEVREHSFVPVDRRIPSPSMSPRLREWKSVLEDAWLCVLGLQEQEHSFYGWGSCENIRLCPLAFEDRVPTCAKCERMFLEWRMLCGCVAMWFEFGSTRGLLPCFWCTALWYSCVCGTLPSVTCLVERLLVLKWYR